MHSNESMDSHFGDSIVIGFACSELLFAFLSLPISAVNLYLVGRSPVIHINLKAILLFQSCAIALRAFCRCAICIHKIVLNQANPNASESLEPFHFIYFFCYQSRNFCEHILIIERVWATYSVRKYETRRNLWFTLIWLPIVCGWALYNVILPPPPSSVYPLINLLTNISLFLLGSLEFLLFIWLCFFNKKIYVRYLNAKEGHNLSERYQLSENVRIGRQLIPALCCHLWSVTMTMSTQCFGQFGPNQYYNFVLSISNNSGSLCGLLIEFTMIYCHPFLRRNFLHLLSKITQFPKRISRVRPTQTGFGIQQQTLTLKNLDGNELMMEGRDVGAVMEDHFSMLKKSWGE